MCLDHCPYKSRFKYVVCIPRRERSLLAQIRFGILLTYILKQGDVGELHMNKEHVRFVYFILSLFTCILYVNCALSCILMYTFNYYQHLTLTNIVSLSLISFGLLGK